MACCPLSECYAVSSFCRRAASHVPFYCLFISSLFHLLVKEKSRQRSHCLTPDFSFYKLYALTISVLIGTSRPSDQTDRWLPFFRQKAAMDCTPKPCPACRVMGKPSPSKKASPAQGLEISSITLGVPTILQRISRCSSGSFRLHGSHFPVRLQ